MSSTLRRTKIVATLGPSTESPEILEAIIRAGANVVRMNFSHGTAEDHKNRAQKVREIAAKLGRHVALLGDLQGPKIRVSTFKEGKIILNEGEHFILDAELAKGEGTQESVGIDYKKLPQDVCNDDILLLDDGRVQLQVMRVEGNKIHTKVLVGGPLSNNKGINKKGGGLSADALTEKDKNDIRLAAEIQVEYLAVSFPRNENIDDIVRASDVIMVARGDLGVEIGDPELIAVQKKLISRAKKLNRVVITATQMMESMISNPMPTRAEVMDVANAVLDGTDAVMLSGETAAGKYPVETVKAMAEVCIGAEKMIESNEQNYRIKSVFRTEEEAIAMSTIYAANHLEGVKAMVTLTESGRTALMTSRLNSVFPIFAMSANQATLNRCALLRGVIPFYFDTKQASGLEAAIAALDALKERNLLEEGDLVIITQGDIMGVEGSTNCMRILPVY